MTTAIHAMRKPYGWLVALVMLVLLSACKKDQRLFDKLDNVSAGIDFENKLTPNEDLNIIDYIYYYNGGGVAIGDINNDGLPDIFFTGNQVKNKLYLNRGNLQFEDITETAGVAGNSTWNTGAAMGDVNGDGLLDIYVCAVVGLKNLDGHNELYINNGDNTFTERSAEYELDFEAYSSAAAFLDYDLDGDLDIFLLCHAVHTSGSFGHANLRNTRTYESGGKLLRNDGSKFVDVSAEANIYGGINSYGLGLTIADFNVDGYPDIYVGNDFHEDDYYYVNQGDGTFAEVGKASFTSMSKFTMGLDAVDVNHDGFPDLMSLDMLPEDEVVLKRSVDEENHTLLKMRTRRYGYHYQYPRNMMQINLGNGQFAETALMGGIAATDWSWSALFSDFDQDGHHDLFVSNGIPRRPNDLDYIKFVSSEQVVNTMETTKLVDDKALSMMPSGEAQNYLFKGTGGYVFENRSTEWLPQENTCSTAAAYGDLDNDGDLDIVVNNVDKSPIIYVNQINGKANYLKIQLKYNAPNQYGIGTRVYAFNNGDLQLREMYTSRGFQSSSEPIIHFGCGSAPSVDSIVVVWPDGRVQKHYDVPTNQTLTVSPDNAHQAQVNWRVDSKPLFRQVEPQSIGLDFEHREDSYSDFDRLKLLPYSQADRGPATALGDLNNDGLQDVYFGGSKFIPSQVFLQSDEGFMRARIPEFESDSINEEVEAVIADFNGDSQPDLFVGTGGADFYGRSAPLLDCFYISENDGYTLMRLPDYYENASCVRPFDFDGDGDMDLFVGNESVSGNFGAKPKSYLLTNTGGSFEPVQPELFGDLGMITDAIWDDYDKDGNVDLIVVGEWMQPMFLKNKNGVFERDDVVRGDLLGLWQSVMAFDIDDDGDTDYLLGNWGLNSRFSASGRYPMKMYYNDFDANGQYETVIAIAKNGKYYPLDSFDMLASQINGLRKKYTNYKDFAGKTIEEVFDAELLKSAVVYEISELASGYLKNVGGRFEFAAFPMDLQIAPIMAQLRYDFDADGKEEVLLAGNYFGVQPFHGRFGSFTGAIIKGADQVISGLQVGLDLVNRSVRHLNILRFRNRDYLLVTVNDGRAQLYELLR
ncbi:MAG TPA: VCBS repeat-containing protein [Cyclobacteriaceae bacterium]